MQALDPSGTYTDAEVIDALSGRLGPRTMNYRYDRLDELNTYLEPIDYVTSGKVSNNALAEIKRTAEFAILDRGGINFLKDRIRPWARLSMPDGGLVEWPLGVFLLSTPDRALSTRGTVTREVKAYDQLVLLRDDTVSTRYSFAEGVAYTDAMATLVGTVVGVTAAIVPSDLVTPSVLEWEPGTTKLRILNDILAGANYGSAWFDESGTLICQPYQSPSERASEYTYADGSTGVRVGDATQTLDLMGVPNKWTLVSGDPAGAPIVATYTNENPRSPTSTVSRGRTIAAPVETVEAADLATLEALAERRAFSASQIYEGLKFSTAAMPMHSNADVFTLTVPGLSIDGKFSEHSWTLELKAGASMEHVVRRVVSV